MKKFGLIVSALALVLGLSQCKKPNAPTFGGDVSTRTIEFTTGYGGGEKGSFDELNKNLQYRWNEATDKLYVYAQDGGTTFSGGKFVGTLPMVELSEDGFTATFRGSLSIPSGGVLRFVHYGSSVNVNEETGVASVDFSIQNVGNLDEISSKVVAICDKEYNGNSIFEEVDELSVQFAVVKLKFSGFGDGDITVKGMSSTGLDVATNGVITNNTKISSTLKTPGTGDFYTVFMPTTQKTSFELGNVTDCSTNSWALGEGKFYRENDGGAVLITPASLAGNFTVNQETNTKVKFSRGNLYWDNAAEAGKQWKFEARQWDFRTYSGKDAKFNGSTDVTPTDDWGLFGWSTPATNYGMSTSTTPEDYSGNFKDWGQGNTIYDNVTATTGWRTLSIDEWKNLLGLEGASHPRTNAQSKRGIKTIEGVLGLVVLPDNTDASVLAGITDAATLASAGALFLPAAGARNGENLSDFSVTGNYWSSNSSDNIGAYLTGFSFNGSDVVGVYTNCRNIGQSVRLAR